MPLFKCKHGVYGADEQDGYSGYCCICKPPVPLTPQEETWFHAVAEPKEVFCNPQIIEREGGNGKG
jgi:hypothetical protein